MSKTKMSGRRRMKPPFPPKFMSLLCDFSIEFLRRQPGERLETLMSLLKMHHRQLEMPTTLALDLIELRNEAKVAG